MKGKFTLWSEQSLPDHTTRVGRLSFVDGLLHLATLQGWSRILTSLDAQQTLNNGRPAYFDQTLNYLISTDTVMCQFSKNGGSRNEYLNYVPSILSSNSGFVVTENAVIKHIGLVIQTTVNSVTTFQVRKNGQATAIASAQLPNGQRKIVVENVNVAVMKNDELSLYVSGSTSVSNAVVCLYLTYRN